MISKKLLSEVIGVKISGEPFAQNVDNLIGYVDGDVWISTNIHELAHKCKEWAVNIPHYNWRVKSYVAINHVSSDVHYDSISTTKDYYAKVSSCNRSKTALFMGNSEPEAIFKACEWILNEK